MGLKQFLVLQLVISLDASAIVVKLSDLHTMAKRSDIVVHGVVGEQTTATDELSRPVTLTEVEVVDSFLGGKTGDVITIYQVGGQKDGRIMPLLGGQKYNVGQEVIFFGLKLGDAYVSYGAGQGKLDVINNNGQNLVVEDLGDVDVLDLKKNTTARPMPETYQGLDILKGEIRQMIKSR